VPDPVATAVIPFRNAGEFLRLTAPTVIAAAIHHGATEVVYVDNGSTDDSVEVLQALGGRGVTVVTKTGGTIAAVRNFGASFARGKYISFLDADCVIQTDYFNNAIETLETTGSAATGCEVSLPENPHWIERVWDSLHYVGRNREVHYINSANFFIERRIFYEVGRFDETLITGEDSEIGLRLTDGGYGILESTRVKAIHLGNPKSIPTFFRRNVWHSVGMIGSQHGARLDKPTAMLAAHLMLTLGWIVLLITGSMSGAAMVGLLLASQIVVPFATVVFRWRQVRRRIELLPALFLYWLYFWARAYGLLLISVGRDARFRK
jgi:glycosyltransferase involved in cell wall biosynthesis